MRDKTKVVEAIESFKEAIDWFNELPIGVALATRAMQADAKNTIADVAAAITRLYQFPDSSLLKALRADSVLQGVQRYHDSLPPASQKFLIPEMNMLKSAVEVYSMVFSPSAKRVMLSEVDPDELSAIQELTDDISEEDVLLLRAKNLLEEQTIPKIETPIIKSGYPPYDKFDGMHPLDKVLVDSGVETQEGLDRFRILPMGDEELSREEDPEWIAASIDVIEGERRRAQEQQMSSAKVSDSDLQKMDLAEEHPLNTELTERADALVKLGKKLLELSGYNHEG